METTLAHTETEAPTQQVVARSAMWSVLENGGLAAISFGMLIVFARFLTPADFGLFSVVLAVIEILAVMSGMLFHDALVQRRDIEAEHWDTAYTVSLAFGLVLMMLCWLIAPLFSVRVGLPQAGTLLAFAAMSLPIAAAATVLIAQQRRAMAFRVLAVRSTVSRIAGAALGLVAVLVGYGVWGLAIQHLAMAVVGWLMLWWAVPYRPRMRVSSAATIALLRVGAPNVGALLLAFATKRLFVILSAIALGPEPAGYLNLALRLVDVLWAVAAAAISQVSLPVMSRLQGELPRQINAYRRSVEYCALMLFSVFAALAAGAPEIVTLLFGERWQPAAPAVMALALLIVLQLPNLMAQILLKAKGYATSVLLTSFLELVAMTAAFELLFRVLLTADNAVPVQGIAAALAVWTTKEALLWATLALLIHRKLGLRWSAQIAPIAGPLAFGVLALGAGAVVRALLPADCGPVIRLVGVASAALVTFWAAASLFRRSRIEELASMVKNGLTVRMGNAQSPAGSA